MAWVTAQKAVGGFFGAFPMLAGLLVWLSMAIWLETWHLRQLSEARRRAMGYDETGAVVMGSIVTAACVVLHVATALLKRWLTRRTKVLDLSSKAWRVLFAWCYGAGFVMGALVYFTAPI